MRHVNVLVVHAEKLHDRGVARAAIDVATRLRAAGIRATFLVYPHRAKSVGREVADEIRQLMDLGHEIGQHTHAYRGEVSPGRERGAKIIDGSYANVRECILRDMETLRQAGVVPRGFSAGGWLVPDYLFELLADLGFTYDCSTRIGSPRTPVSGWRQWPQASIHEHKSGALALLPTHCSVRRWMLDARSCTSPVRIFYCHDYDLVEWRERALLDSCWRFLRAASFCSAGEAADRLLRNDREPVMLHPAGSSPAVDFEERAG